MPDFYQGTELWDFSLVDPDNRRPVDFDKRVRFLKGLKPRGKKTREALVRELLDHWPDGRIKLYVIQQGLNLRRKYPDLFRYGEYLPLTVAGPRQNQVLALARRHGSDWVIAVAGRFFTALTPLGRPPTGPEVWGDSALILPEEAPEAWRDIFTEKICQAESTPKKRLPLRQVLRHLPVAFLAGSGG